LRDVDFAEVERALEFLDAPTRDAQADLAAGLRLLWERDRLWLADWETDLPAGAWPQLPPHADLTLEAPGALELPGGWRLTAEPVADVEAALDRATDNDDPFQAWLDLDRLRLPLQVRPRRPGDRFRPLGMGGHSLKLSDLMINLELPRRARDRWPLLVSDGEIVWVIGARVGHLARISQATQRLVHTCLMRK
jgi:tRNA(Ile)-lysidine synthase